jgi:RHS repeat-associated protein
MTNALGAALTFAYDNVDRLTTQTSAGGRITTYAYDARSLLAKIVDPTGNAAVLTCDAAGRLTKLVDPLSEVDTTYDAKNRRLSVVEGAKSIGYAYDALDRLTRFTDANGNVLQYDYDANGNLITLTYPDGKKVTYTYDADNRLATVTDWVARVTQYTYDADSRLVKTVRPNGTVQTQTFDAAGQLTGLADTASDHSTIVQCAYTYDAAGKRLATTRSPAPSVYAPTALTLTYDVDDRLTAYAGQAVSANLNGDMLTTPLSGVLAPATYDARDRLASAGGITYTYDAENRRLQETAASATTTYVVNPNAPLSQLLVSTTSGGSTTRYVYGLGLIYQDTDATTVRYLHADAQGSTVALTEAAGTVTGRVDYGPYGEIIAQTGDTATAFQYLGQAGVETDGNGLVFMRARTYNPQVRRFLQPDPWLGSVAVPGSADRYAYVGDNPANRTDVRGFNWLPDSGSDFNGPVVSGSGSPAPGTVSTDEKGWTQPFAILPGNGAGHGPTKGTLDALDNTLAGAGVVQTGAQYGNVAGIATLGSNLKFYQSGWGGGSVARITTTKVAPLVEDLGGVLTLGSLALDSYNYNKGTVSAQKLGTDTIVAGVGTFGGLAGAAVSVIYTGVDKLYPGGWLGENGSTTPYHGAGLLADYGTAYARAQAVTPVPIFSLY